MAKKTLNPLIQMLNCYIFHSIYLPKLNPSGSSSGAQVMVTASPLRADSSHASAILETAEVILRGTANQSRARGHVTGDQSELTCP